MSAAWLGIDLGTSSAKCVAIDDSAALLASAQERYGVDRPSPGWAEQDPELWWSAVSTTIAAVVASLPPRTEIRGIGLSGQMHGVVLVDASGRAVRPAIIWSDARSGEDVQRWRDEIGDERIERISGFRSASGMAGISLSWLSREEPEALDAAVFAMQPKDFIRLRLTGEPGLDLSDAGASLLFDLDEARPSDRLLAAAGVTPSLLPPLFPTLGVAGKVTASTSAATGVPRGAVVATGGGDQAMTALALGVDRPGRAAMTLSSGGTVLTSATSRVPDGYHRLASAQPSRMMAMGVVLAAGLATGWLAGVMGRDERELLHAAASAEMDEGLSAIADLGGTRTPVVDATPRGAFDGLGFHHTSEHLMRAVVEGVAVSLADSLAAVSGGRLDADTTVVLSGGGSRFAVWRQAVADATGIPVVVSADVEHAALGAALAGAAAAGDDIHFIAHERVKDVVEPDHASVSRLRAVRAAHAHRISTEERARQ